MISLLNINHSMVIFVLYNINAPIGRAYVRIFVRCNLLPKTFIPEGYAFVGKLQIGFVQDEIIIVYIYVFIWNPRIAYKFESIKQTSFTNTMAWKHFYAPFSHIFSPTILALNRQRLQTLYKYYVCVSLCELYYRGNS